MRHGRTLLARLGSAGALGAVALCILILLSAYLAVDDHGLGVTPREHRVIRLPEAELPRVALARPSRRPALEVAPPVAEPGDAVDALTPRRR